MKKRKLGIIGGSGLYNIEGFENEKWKKVKTPWGKPALGFRTRKNKRSYKFISQRRYGR